MSVVLVIAALGVITAGSASSEMIAVSACILSLRGIYSVSFLKVWSLQILNSVARGSDDESGATLLDLAKIRYGP